MTMTLASFLTEVTDALTGFVPDLGIYVAAAAVVSLAVFATRRLAKALR
jgi:hypothetical protein